MSTPGNDEVERKREALEELIRRQDGIRSTPVSEDGRKDGNPAAGAGGFQFVPPGTSSRAPIVVDDVAEGLEQVADVGRRSSGLLLLLVEICVGGILSPIGFASVALFGLLYASGEFGTVRFLSEAPGAAQGGYYRMVEVPEMVDPSVVDADTDTGDDTVWPRPQWRFGVE